MMKTFDDQTRSRNEHSAQLETQGNVINRENRGKVYPVCYRCAQVPQNGLYDGFRIRGMFICSDCQNELLSAEQDTPEYQEFLFLIHSLLF
ncbi:Inhibitor of sigma-G Gin [Desulfosporosinus acidiphilus SJ4]|uniref:Inhibitor of sigma-G Gin n=1 Tax=Desulfosporosinus acidiphilus (strain DSM 22704 / JCM 16185 / SJ4) TaxID=646529 RepID=I4D020_DESAJ|nr:sigma factor G inhibitor Gin [Desulfosporosinus acidiphilus]AFM39144.1 Inhibitor of sigma-G Gin [Desulfosporosinus acidiphilus SJ4]